MKIVTELSERGVMRGQVGAVLTWEDEAGTGQGAAEVALQGVMRGYPGASYLRAVGWPARAKADLMGLCTAQGTELVSISEDLGELAVSSWPILVVPSRLTGAEPKELIEHFNPDGGYPPLREVHMELDNDLLFGVNPRWLRDFYRVVSWELLPVVTLIVRPGDVGAVMGAASRTGGAWRIETTC